MALFNLSKDISDFGAGTWDLDLAVDPANFLDDCSNLLRLGVVEWFGLALSCVTLLARARRDCPRPNRPLADSSPTSPCRDAFTKAESG